MPSRRAIEDRTWSAFEPFALDLATLEHVGRQRPQDGFLPEAKAQRLHAADEPALPVAHRRKGVGQPVAYPS